MAIRNRKYASQIIEFKGMEYGKMSPTNLDLFYDIKNTLFIVGECKYKDSEIPLGQRLALEHLVDNLHASGKKTLGLIISHDGVEPIEISKCNVTEIRYEGRWEIINYTQTVKEMTDRFTSKYITLNK